MRTSRFVVAAVATVTVGLSLAACGKSGTPSAGPNANASSNAGTGDKCVSSGVTLTPATAAVTGSPTYDKIKSAGKVVVGVKADQPSLGYKDASGQRCGFDIEIAQLVAAKLGVSQDKIEYKEIPSANRETAIKGGDVDYYVGTYSITDKRKQDVAFAGPYFVAGQDLLVRKDDTSITGQDTLKGKKVCSATGSTPLQRVRDQKLTDDANISEFETYSECVSQLLDKRVDAVTTDDAILKGYAAQEPGQAQGRRQAVQRGEVRHRAAAGRHGAARLRQRRPRRRRSRTAPGRRSTTTRSAGPARRPPRRRSSGTDQPVNRPVVAARGHRAPSLIVEVRWTPSCDTLIHNGDLFWRGFRATVELFLVGRGGRLVLGTLLAAVRVSPVPVLRGVGTGVRQQLIRNTPLTLIFAFLVFAAAEARHRRLDYFPSACIALIALHRRVRLRGDPVRRQHRPGRAGRGGPGARA